MKTRLGAALIVLCLLTLLLAPASTARTSTIQFIDRMGKIMEIKPDSPNSYSASAMYKRSSGAIEGPYTYTGIRLLDILALAGGIRPGDAVEITATDGYRMTFTYEQVKGEVLIYTPSGDPIGIGGVEAMIAFSTSDARQARDMPRMVYVGSNNPLTDGHYWIKNVARIRLVPGVSEWVLKLHGYLEATMDRSTFESTATCGLSPHPGGKWETVSKSGEVSVYEGIPLWVLVSIVDGPESPNSHYTYDRDLARKGYKVQVISSDGAVVELGSADVMDNWDIILAYAKNGAPLGDDEGPLKLVGAGLPTRQANIKNVVEIRLVGIPKN